MSGKQAKRARRAAREAEAKRAAMMAPKETETVIYEPEKQREIMKLSKAKDLAEYGVARGVLITPNPMSDGWLLEIVIETGDRKTLETDRGEVRVFKTIDTAFKTAETIGFETAQVIRRRSNLHQ